MPTTLAAAKAGRAEVRAEVHYRVPLKDPQAEGNMGLQGFDEDGDGRRFPTAGLARHWAEIQALAHVTRGHGIDHVSVRTGRWEADNFHDERYGYVEDAVWVPATEQIGYLEGDRVAWSPPEDVSP